MTNKERIRKISSFTFAFAFTFICTAKNAPQPQSMNPFTRFLPVKTTDKIIYSKLSSELIKHVKQDFKKAGIFPPGVNIETHLKPGDTFDGKAIHTRLEQLLKQEDRAEKTTALQRIYSYYFNQYK